MPEHSFVAIVPARGGSTRVSRKNLALLGGRPLLAYTLDACREAGLADRVFVSTEDEEIAAAAAKWSNANVIRRPIDLATATASTESVVLHALAVLNGDGIEADWVITLPPTAPFRTGASIRAFCNAVTAAPRDQDCLMSVTENRGDFWRTRGDGLLERLVPNTPRRQQDRTPLLEENSAIYVTRVDALRATGSLLGARVRGMVLDPPEGFDINTEFDLRVAEAMLSTQGAHMSVRGPADA